VTLAADLDAELLTARDFEPTTFPNDEHDDELVVVKESRSSRSASTTCPAVLNR
jgi:hypothetical protein